MTLVQGEAFALVASMLILFGWGPIRYDVIAAALLSVATLIGVIPPDKAFAGFSNPVIIIIASVLIIGRAIEVSGVVEAAMRAFLDKISWVSLQIAILTGSVTLLSAFIKNVGTLGIFMPIAIRTAERTGRSSSDYLMPLSFGSLIGGTITLIGTSPNLLISTVREDLLGHPYQLFDFAPVGLPLSIIALLFLSVGWRLIPRNRQGSVSPDHRFEIEHYVSEALVPAGSQAVGKTVGELETLGESDVSVIAIVREGGRRYVPGLHWTLFAGDLLVLRADPVAIEAFINRTGLRLQGKDSFSEQEAKEVQLESVEAVIGGDSLLIGKTPVQLDLRRRFGVHLLAIGRGDGDSDINTRLSRTRLQVGDVILLQGPREHLTKSLGTLGCLPLAERNLALGKRRPKPWALLILLVAMMLVAFRVIPVATAFFTATVLVALFRLIPLREVYESIDWKIVIMLGCLIPIGEALRDTGAAGLIGNMLTLAATHVSPVMALALILAVSMLVTPFLHHAAAVLVMGPIAAVVANNLGYSADPFLMAVALGASCDFLTPIGHQNNLLVMGPGGYRFGDYWRLGLPLSIVVVVFGTWLIQRHWPL